MIEAGFRTDYNPLVSVIIPLYNAEKYIAETIENVLKQTYSNIEIIIIDDGSTDKSLSIAKSFEGEKVKVFSQLNKGASAARNYGLREAKGDFIQFLDADDLLSDNKIEEQVNLLISSKANSIAVCSTTHFFEKKEIYQKEVSIDGWFEKIENPVEFIIKLYGGYTGVGGMIAIHAWLTPIALIDKVGFWNEELSVDDDGEFFCRVILASEGVVYSNRALNYYRMHRNGGNLSSQKSRKAIHSIFLSTQLKEKHLLSATTNANARSAIARLYLDIAVSCYPSFYDLSKKAEMKVIELGGCSSKHYTHTPTYRIITPLLGWKTSALMAYYKNKLRELNFFSK
jgi:glycosyltransferase involved in cell wall biosynthesis